MNKLILNLVGSTDHLNVVGRIELEKQFQWFYVQRFKEQLTKLSKIWLYLSYYITPKQVPCSSGWYSPSEWHICWTFVLFEGEDPYKKDATSRRWTYTAWYCIK